MSGRSWVGLTVAALALLPAGAAAQHPPPPPRVEQLFTSDGLRLDYPADGVWRRRAAQVMATRARLLAQRRFAALNSALAPGAQPSIAMTTAVAGVLKIPTILVAYTNTDTTGAQWPKAAQYDSLFNSAVPLTGRPYTVRTFYEEMSNGLLSVLGTVYGWVRLDTTSAFYLTACGGGGANALNCSLGRQRLHDLIDTALAKLDATVDFSQFDADGDGVVDDIRIVQPMISGECSGPGYGSHHFSLDGLVPGGAFTTNDPWPGHPGLFIKVNSYHLISGLGGTSCFNAAQITGIGDAAHELGHGLGLPDLYDVSYATNGIGEWGLMGEALYTSLNSPGHDDAWSKQQLGWVSVTPLSTDGTYTIDPVVSSHQVYLVRPQGPNPRGEYFLLENKQALGADTANMLTGGQAGPKVGGLLIWHVDSTQVVNHSVFIDNQTNVGPIHGVELVQADALRQLDGLNSPNRGDAGDPYPGSTRNQLYSFNGAPPALKNSDGSFVGFAIDSVAQVVPNARMRFRIRFGVTAPTLSATAVVSQLLRNDMSLSPDDQRSLDFLGNGNGVFDLGDFLAWVRRTRPTPP